MGIKACRGNATSKLFEKIPQMMCIHFNIKNSQGGGGSVVVTDGVLGVVRTSPRTGRRVTTYLDWAGIQKFSAPGAFRSRAAYHGLPRSRDIVGTNSCPSQLEHLIISPCYHANPNHVNKHPKEQ